jgi:pSer/pThr/pTyr-binding forkhead associated (FHA) protein
MGRVFLRVVSGNRQGLSVPLEPDAALLIGRSRGDLLIDDPLASGSHCRIYGRGGRFYVQDLGSTNGTKVGGRQVQEAHLEAGVELLIGTTRLLVFETEDPSTPALDTDSDHRVAWLLEDDLGDADTVGDDLVSHGLRLPPRFEGRFEVVAGPDLGKNFRITRGLMVIGRKQGELPLSDVEISRRHAQIEVFGSDMIFLRDFASTNGTYHNGRRVQLARISTGDSIGCGKSVLRFLRG